MKGKAKFELGKVDWMMEGTHGSVEPQPLLGTFLNSTRFFKGHKNGEQMVLKGKKIEGNVLKNRSGSSKQVGFNIIG